MINPGQLLKKAMRPWADGSFLRGWLCNEDPFPLVVDFGKPSGRQLRDDFADVRKWIATLKHNSKENKGLGYTIDYRTVNHHQLGRQHLPHRIYFASRDDWLHTIGKEQAFNSFKRLAHLTSERQPELFSYLVNKPLKALAHRDDWARLLAVCRWFKDNPNPDRYLRQLDIPGVDTKFIETRKGLLSDLLSCVLDDTGMDHRVTGLARHGFERRFGLKYDQPQVRFRILDDKIAMEGLTDLCLPIEDVRSNDFGATAVFITENKINGLAFPPTAGALIIFGLGYGIELLADITWLSDKQITYWGDLDTHGFAMLSQVRGYFPQTRSLLMDRDTLLRHRHLWVTETPAKRFTGGLVNLTGAENDLFCELKENRWGRDVRLEQERIAFSHLLQALAKPGRPWK